MLHSLFTKDRSRTDGLYVYCKACKNATASEYAARPGVKARLRLQKYGVTQEWYDQTLHAQDYGCAICGTSDPVGRGKHTRTFSVDHDHHTDEVRGLLCSKCNLGIGQLNDDAATVAAALNYLLKHKS